MYEVSVKQIEEKTVSKRDFRDTGEKDEKGETVYRYIAYEAVEPVSKEVLKFALSDADLDVKHLAAFLSGRIR